MKKSLHSGLKISAVLLLLALISSTPAVAGPRATRHKTALDKYVFAPDANYGYQLVNTIEGDGYTAFLLSMRSQAWRNAQEVDRPVWEHWLLIIQPDQVKESTGLLLIGGGSNGRRAPRAPSPLLTSLAVRTQSVVAELRMVPNQPLVFAGEDKSRTEDGIIAYSWDKFLRTGDESWPLRLPMTKSAVRAMDTITSFCGSPERGSVAVNRFVVAGGSKRGWTAWATAAVDDRVVAVAPFVIDVLNVEKSMEHHYRAYGFWAPAIHDYTEMNLHDWSGTPQYETLMRIEDPYSYKDRLTMPKLIVNSAGDEYFLPDSWQFYFDDLQGDKYLRYVPNTKHSLENSDALVTLQAFYEAIATGSSLPRFSWKFEKEGAIVVHATDKPVEVKLWQATNPKARDFRLDTIGPAYTSTTLSAQEDGTYVGRVPPPAEGWTAYFVELTFVREGKLPVKLSTGVRVIPDLLPFASPAKSGR